jgi:hypothetical protein
MTIRIQEVSTKSDLKKFVLFPHKLYSGNQYWVPEIIQDEIANLSADKNPAFDYCEAAYWLAYRGHEIVGRVAGIINRAYNSKCGKQYARFGWIDFIDDESVSKALLNTVEEWARKKNMTALHGPLGFTDFDPEGMVIEGFEEIGTMTTIYNSAHYPLHLEKLLYSKDADWLEYRLMVPNPVSDRIEKMAQHVAEKNNLQILKTKRRSALRPYARGVFELVNETYKDLYGVVRLSERQIQVYIKQYFSFIDPEYVTIVLHDNKVAAFAIAMPSLSKALQKAKGKLFPFGFIHILKAFRNNDTADLYLIAVRTDLQRKGVTAMIIHDLGKKFIKNNIKHAITHPMLEENDSVVSLWKHYDKKLIRKRRCFSKLLV